MKKIVSILLILCILSTFSFAQKHQKYDKKKAQLRKRIEFTQKLLKKNNGKEASIGQLRLLKSNISNRKILIKEINKEIRQIETDISNINSQVLVYERQVEVLKKDYAKLIRVAYRNKTGLEKILFIFSANTFQQAFNRFRYLIALSQKRKFNIQKINNKKDELISSIRKLMQEKDKKKLLILEKKNENTRLVSDGELQSNTVSILRKQENLEEQIRTEENANSKLDTSVIELVTKNVNELVERSQKEASRKFSTNTSVADDNSFASRKGDLDMPVKIGVIVGSFGIHEHPVLENIKLRNDGVDISTEENAEVLAVAKGKVISIIEVPYKNMAVLLKHGDYFTLYSNLVDVKVVVGETVSEDKVLGKVFTNEADKSTILQFQIWYKNTRIDPQLWLRNP